ncbi:MAG: hypothetical protein AAF573_13750 [Bacteroidota bacterium]
MLRFYTPIALLQLFCLYQAYTRNEEQKWFWIIIFFPLIGSLFYLYHTFYSRENIENIAEGVKSNFIDNYKTSKLERELNFSDTFTNKVKLADEYYRSGDYEVAMQLYDSCLEGIYEDDKDLLMKLLRVHYQLKNYDEIIKHGEKIIDDKSFKSSEEVIFLAWAYREKGMTEKAEKLFQSADFRFSNYNQRIEYAKFLEQIGKVQAAKEKLEELLQEIEAMERQERRQKKQALRYIKNYYAELDDNYPTIK